MSSSLHAVLWKTEGEGPSSAWQQGSVGVKLNPKEQIQEEDAPLEQGFCEPKLTSEAPAVGSWSLDELFETNYRLSITWTSKVCVVCLSVQNALGFFFFNLSARLPKTLLFLKNEFFKYKFGSIPNQRFCTWCYRAQWCTDTVEHVLISEANAESNLGMLDAVDVNSWIFFIAEKWQNITIKPQSNLCVIQQKLS